MTNSFETHGIDHLSPSSINAWINAPSLWVLERLCGYKGQMGAAAHRGTATEVGVSAGLFDHTLSLDECTALALPVYDRLTALSGDPKRDSERMVIVPMVRQGLGVLRAHGVPFAPNEEPRYGAPAQHRIEVMLDGVSVPVIGFLDFLYETRIEDLKTTLRLPSSMSPTHLRQATTYKAARPSHKVYFTYVTDKKSATYKLERPEYDQAMLELVGAAKRLERFLAISDDKEELAALVPHSSDSFYFSDPGTLAAARKLFGY